MARSRITNVLFCTPNFSGGGAEAITIAVAHRLNSNTFDTTLLAHEDHGPLRGRIPETLTVKSINKGPYRRRHLPRSLMVTIYHSLRADVVVAASEGRVGVLSLIAAKVTGRPAVAWIHLAWSQFSGKVSWRSRFSLRLLNFFNTVVCVSQGVADEVVARGVARHRVVVINNLCTIDVLKNYPQATIDADDESLFEKPVIINAGRLDYQKNHAALLHVHERLVSTGVSHNLVILGTGPELDRLTELAMSLGIENSVHFLGFKGEPHRYFRRSAAFALTSRFEGFAMVLSEAMTCGVPVVSFDCPHGPREVLADGNAGSLIANGDIAGMVDALKKILTDQHHATDLAQRGKTRAQAFQPDRIIRQWNATLDDTVSDHKARAGDQRRISHPMDR